ncbi:MAG: hypothetical protein ACE1ZQ_08050 [Ignavibacteriaceae bacterium]
MFRIVYQSYGNNDVFKQTLFSIFTLQYYLSETRINFPYSIIVYTDKPEIFSKYNLETSLLSQNLIQEWKGKYNFLHRVKIIIIEDAARRSNDSIIYIDSDTYFIKSPILLFKKISSEISLMLNNEGQISKNNQKLLFNFLSNKTNLDIGNNKIFMWNAGLIGIDKSNIHLINKILELNDNIYEKFYRHIVEQFSFSYYLQINTNIYSCDDYLIHYCGDKELVVEIISRFLEIQKAFPMQNIYKNANKLEPLKKIKKKEKNLFERFVDVFIRLRKSINKRIERLKIKLQA